MELHEYWAVRLVNSSSSIPYFPDRQETVDLCLIHRRLSLPGKKLLPGNHTGVIHVYLYGKNRLNWKVMHKFQGFKFRSHGLKIGFHSERNWCHDHEGNFSIRRKISGNFKRRFSMIHTRILKNYSQVCKGLKILVKGLVKELFSGLSLPAFEWNIYIVLSFWKHSQNTHLFLLKHSYSSSIRIYLFSSKKLLRYFHQ